MDTNGAPRDIEKIRVGILGIATLILLAELYYSFYIREDLSFLKGTTHAKVLLKLAEINIVKNVIYSKILIFGLIAFHAISNSKKKKLDLTTKQVVLYLFVGLVLHFGSIFIDDIMYLYQAISFFAYFIMIYAFAKVKQVLNNSFMKDRFDREAKVFNQNEIRYETEYSVNFITEYNAEKGLRTGEVSVINPFRANLVVGTPGCGKSYVFFEEAIEQHIKKGFTLSVYDFKNPTLTEVVYNYHMKYKKLHNNKFCRLDFDNPQYSNRCNPIKSENIKDFTDAVEAATISLLSLNREWIKKQGDFFVESAINYFAICIWALKLKANGRYCSFPHAIELVCLEYDEAFAIIKSTDNASAQNVLKMFTQAKEDGAMEQLSGQIASAKNALARLTSEKIYWMLTEDENEQVNCSLDINNPDAPKILCIANNPQRKEIYGAALSLYNNKLISIVNKQGKLPSALMWDELPTIFLGKGTLDNLIATARSNKVAVWVGIQDFTQIIRDYGKEVAEAIINTIGNLFCGKVLGETADKLSKRMGKIKVQRTSVSLGEKTTPSLSEQMVDLIPPDEISTLSQGHFFGVFDDDFSTPIEEKRFYGKFIIDDVKRKNLPKQNLPVLNPLGENGKIASKEIENEILEKNMQQIRDEIKMLAQFCKENGDIENIEYEKEIQEFDFL